MMSVTDIKSAVELVILEMTDLEGRGVFREDWKELNVYLRLLIPAGMNRQPVCRMQRQAGQHSTLLLKSAGRWFGDKLTLIRTLWDKPVEQLPLLYTPDPNITVDDRLEALRGHGPFRHYIP